MCIKCGCSGLCFTKFLVISYSDLPLMLSFSLRIGMCQLRFDVGSQYESKVSIRVLHVQLVCTMFSSFGRRIWGSTKQDV